MAHPSRKTKLAEIFTQLDNTARDLGVADIKVDGQLKITAPKPAGKPAPSTKAIKMPSFAEGLAMVGLDKDLRRPESPSLRAKAYGAATRRPRLGRQAHRRPRCRCQKTPPTPSGSPRSSRPNTSNCKIAEQNMFSVAAGLSAAGKIPFCSTFAKFVVRAYDQVEMAIIGGANLKITGTHAGVTLAADGPSQMSLPDVAFFRSFCHVKNFNGRPAVTYFFPADAVSCYRCTELDGQP